MALSAKAIKGKIDSVRNVGKITKAMELVSVSKMKRATDAVLKTRAYAHRALEILTNVRELTKQEESLLTHGEAKKNLLVIVASNKGLCGSFNVNLEKATRNFVKRIRAKHETEISAVCVGKRAEKIARSLKIPVVASFVEFNENVSLSEARSLGHLIREEFKNGDYYNVVMVYTVYESALSNHVVARQVLPIKRENIVNMLEETWRANVPQEEMSSSFEEYKLEPSPEVLLHEILFRLSDMEVYQGLLESNASEHSARMFSMKNATDNAKKLAGDLTLSYNQARQAGITRELSEIASGADALLEA